MLWPIGIGLIVVVALALGSSSKRDAAPRSMPLEPPDDDSIIALAANDPVGALLEYGTPQDAAKLARQGVDLAGLGYRPPQSDD
jgi:hypothetical protein